MADIDDDNATSLLPDFNRNPASRDPQLSADAAIRSTAGRQPSHLANQRVQDAYDCDLGDRDHVVARLTGSNHPPHEHPFTDDGESQDDNVVAVFVVAFDTKAGERGDV